MEQIKDKTFCLRARSDDGDEVKKGDYLTVDPERVAELGKLVFTGSTVERWSGIGSVVGVVTYIGRAV